MCHRSKIAEIDKFKKIELNKYTELFRNIVSNEIMPVNSSQIGDTTKKRVKIPKMAFHSLFVSLSFPPF